MKITRERLEQILREELAAVTEGAFSDMSAGMGRFHPDYPGSEQAKKDTAEAEARKAKRGPGAFDNMRPEEPDDAFKGLSAKDITVDQPVREGGAQGHMLMGSDYMNALADSPYGQILDFMNAQSSREYEKAAQIRKDLKQSVPSMQWPKIEAVLDKSANLKRMRRNDPYREELRNELKADLETVKAMLLPESKLQKSLTEGMGQALANTIREMLESAVEELGKMHETGSAEYKAAMETLRKEVKLALGKDDLQEGMFSNLKTSIDKVLRPGEYEDRSGTAFTVKRFNEAHESLMAAHDIIYEFNKPLANKINVVASEVLKMRNQMRSGA